MEGLILKVGRRQRLCRDLEIQPSLGSLSRNFGNAVLQAAVSLMLKFLKHNSGDTFFYVADSENRIQKIKFQFKSVSTVLPSNSKDGIAATYNNYSVKKERYRP